MIHYTSVILVVAGQLLGNRNLASSCIVVAGESAGALEALRGDLHESGVEVGVGVGLCDGGVKGWELVVDGLKRVLDGHLDGYKEVDVCVHGSHRDGEVDDVGASADARVKGGEEDLVAAGGQGEGDVEGGVAMDVFLAGLLVAAAFSSSSSSSSLVLRGDLVPSAAGVSRVSSRHRGLVLPGDVGVGVDGDGGGGRVGEGRAALVLDTGA